jgi:hypothetical protein
VREDVWVWKRVQARGSAGSREPGVKVDEDGARKVAGLVGGTPGSAVEVPAGIGEDHFMPMRFEPSPMHEWGELLIGHGAVSHTGDPIQAVHDATMAS